MRISSKGRFAVTAMMDIALREMFGPVPLHEVAKRQQKSLSYLEQLFSKLRHHGLVCSIRGPGGGYTIRSPIDGITLADIISAVEDPPPIKKMSDTSPLQDINHELWDSMSAKMTTFTRSVTLKSLIVHQVALGAKIEYAPAAKALTLKRPDILHARPDVPNSVFALGRIG